MPPPPHTRPENVLKRAQELIGVGQQQAALSILHEHVTSKRTRNSTIIALEPVMLLFVELCVDLKKSKAAKDGLYNYKNTSQNTNVATIELVFRKFIDLAEGKVKEAPEESLGLGLGEISAWPCAVVCPLSLSGPRSGLFWNRFGICRRCGGQRNYGTGIRNTGFTLQASSASKSIHATT